MTGVRLYGGNKQKAQLSVETVIIVGVFLLVAVIMLSVFSQRQADISLEQERVAAQQITDRFASTAVGVYVAGPGAQSTVYIPSVVRSQTVTPFVVDYVMLVQWRDFSASSPVGVPLNTSMDFGELPRQVTVVITSDGDIDAQ